MNPLSTLARPTTASLRAARRARVLVLLGVTCAFMLAFSASSAFAANPSADIDQCANGASVLGHLPCTGAQWQNGNLNGNQAHYNEDESVPYRMRFLNLATGAGNVHHITFAWDTTDNGKHGLDYITDVFATEDNVADGNNPCSGVSGCSLSTFSAFTIPDDPRVTAGPDQAPNTPDDIVQKAKESIRLYGGQITGMSGYSIDPPDGFDPATGYTAHTITRVTVEFTADVSNPVLAWGGHISDRLQWKPELTAANFNGSPYHMRLLDLDGSGGNQDRSLSSDAVISPSRIIVTKVANLTTDTAFPFTNIDAGVGNFSLWYDGSVDNPDLTPATRTFAGLTNFKTYDIGETIPTGWDLTGLACSDPGDNGTTVDPVSGANAGSTAHIDLDEAEDVTCTWTNTRQAGHLQLVKQIDGPADASDSFDIEIKRGATQVGSETAITQSDNGSAFAKTDNITALTGTTYTLNEAVTPGSGTSIGNYTTADLSCTQTGGSAVTPTKLSAYSWTVTVTDGQSVVCTYTNTRKTGTIELTKALVPANDPGKFNLTISQGETTIDSAPDVGNGGTTEANTVSTGSYSLAEAAGTGTSDGDYVESAASCVDAANDNAPAAVTNGSVDVGYQQQIVCTFTNTRKTGTIELKKDIVGAAGANQFAITIDGVASKGGITQSSPDADRTTGVQTVNTGDYTVREAADSETTKLGDYEIALSCTKPNGEQGTQTVTFTGLNPAAGIHVGFGEHVTCTYTNTLIPLSVAIDKKGPALAHDGDKLSYSISVTNPGTTALHNVTVTDQIQGTSHGCDAGGGPTLTGGDANGDHLLQPTETWTYSCTYTVQHGDENAAHQIVNVASVTASDSSGHTVGPVDSSATTKVVHPAIAIDKTGPATGQAGDKIGYVLTVTNPGDTPLTDPTVKVADEQCNGDPVTLLGKGGDASADSLDPGDTWTYSCSVQTAVGDTAVHNTGSVTGCDQLGGCVNAGDSADTTLTQPQQAVLGERVVPGTAKLSGKTGCAAKAFNARVKGTKIATVTFYLDGKVVKRYKKPLASGNYALRINPAKMKLGVHRLVANVTFQSASGTKARTLKLSFQRCTKKLAAPRFTG